MDQTQDDSFTQPAEILLRFNDDDEIVIDWRCPATADEGVEQQFDTARDAVLATLTDQFTDFEEVTSGGSERAGYQHLGDPAECVQSD